MRKFALGFAILALVAAPALAGEKYNKTITIGEKAPSFSGIPAVMGDQEASLSLGDIKEDVVVLVFLANHCPVVGFCEDRIIDLASSYKGKSVKFVGVCVTKADSDRLPAIKDRVKEKGYNFVYGHDESQAIGRAYTATKTPEFFVIDKERNIRYAGAMDDSANDAKSVSKHYLKDAVNALLEGKEIATVKTTAVGCGIGYARAKAK